MSLNILFSKQINRRDFLKKSKDSTLLGLLSIYGVDRFANFLENSLEGKLSLSPQEAEAMGCAPGLIGFKEEAPVIYPRVGQLGQNKVQAPEDGCWIGFYNPYDIILPGYKRNKDTGSVIDYYEKKIGQKPSVLVIFPRIRIWSEFPIEEAVGAASKGVIPLIYAEVGSVKLEDIANGKYDRGIQKFADSAIEYGEKYGGFLISTMREMNGNWYSWGQKSRLFKKTWKQIWKNFEDRKANEYATWVWEVFCPEAAGRNVDYPERYYPGDEYVDWIGLSAFSRAGYRSGTKSFSSLVGTTYREMRWKHRDKPVMMSEFGKTIGSGQARWLRNAFKTIKSWPGMKAATFWNNIHLGLRDDHTLDSESYKVYKEIMRDPHFIRAKYVS